MCRVIGNGKYFFFYSADMGLGHILFLIVITKLPIMRLNMRIAYNTCAHTNPLH